MMESGRVILSKGEWAAVAREEEEEEEEGERERQRRRDNGSVENENASGDDYNKNNGDDASAFPSPAPLVNSPSSATTRTMTTLSVDRLLEAWRLGEKGGAQVVAAAAGVAAPARRSPSPSPQTRKGAAVLQQLRQQLALRSSRGHEELTRARELARMSREGQGRAERWLELWAAGGQNAVAAAAATCRSSPPPSSLSSSPSPSPSPCSSSAASAAAEGERKPKSPPARLPSLSALAAVDAFEVSSPDSAPPEAACPLAVADVLSRGRAASRARAAVREASDRERATSERHRAARAVFDRAAAVAAALGDEQASLELAARAWEHGELARAARARANEGAFAGVNGGHVNRFRLDLHGMHVPEALAALRRHCAALGGLAHPGGVLLHVVTGWGRNSSSGVPRVLPAVLEWLARNSHRFREDASNAGMVYVLLGGVVGGGRAGGGGGGGEGWGSE